MLAWQLRGTQASRAIHNIKAHWGPMVNQLKWMIAWKKWFSGKTMNTTQSSVNTVYIFSFLHFANLIYMQCVSKNIITRGSYSAKTSQMVLQSIYRAQKWTAGGNNVPAMLLRMFIESINNKTSHWLSYIGDFLAHQTRSFSNHQRKTEAAKW